MLNVGNPDGLGWLLGANPFVFTSHALPMSVFQRAPTGPGRREGGGIPYPSQQDYATGSLSMLLIIFLHENVYHNEFMGSFIIFNFVNNRPNLPH